MEKGAEIVNNEVKGHMNNDRKYCKNIWNQPRAKRNLKVNLIGQDAPLDVVTKMDAMIKGLLESLMKTEPDSYSVNNEGWINVSKEVDHGALYDASKRTVDADETVGIDDEDENLFEWFGDVNICQDCDQEEIKNESALRIGDVTKCQSEDAKVAKTINEHIEGAKGRFRLENDKMKMRKGTNYGLLSGYHCNVKHEWDRSFYNHMYLDGCDGLEYRIFGSQLEVHKLGRFELEGAVNRE
ncbi:32106_t:CDS:2 [Gigaspora margarita]|uniref:32106_t:CDS:1 n=1 Tax=Gigaspora margarita TaxID=4874 RepID=A0ABN7UZH7_GIGMA|nr:32106_t:CDS:2 [Gigaspora margarita]